jgi:FxLD family lantipeptide
MNSTIAERTEAGVFADLFDLDVRVEPGQPLGSCNSTDNGCSTSCTSVGCSATCNCR